jgi:hypothetical protein
MSSTYLMNLSSTTIKSRADLLKVNIINPMLQKYAQQRPRGNTMVITMNALKISSLNKMVPTFYITFPTV